MTPQNVECNQKLQVLMPVFNASKFLEEAVESLQRQTFRDWQLLIIDDGSDDDSLAIIRKLAALDSRILYQTQNNIGLVGTLNKLVKWSTAPLLARMDADDISKPDRFFKQLRFMDERPDIDIVGCWVELFGAKSEIWHFRESDNNTRILSLFGQCCVTHASLIVKRQVFETVPYDANYEHTEDLEFLSRIITKTDFRFGNVRECLYRYRMHHKSIVYVQAQKRKVAYEKLLELHFERLGITLSRTQYLDYWSFLKTEQVDRNTGRRIGLLLDKIRQSISSFLPDEHHEIAFRWWKYCRLNNFLDLYPLCKAQAFMFLEQKTAVVRYDICDLITLNGFEYAVVGSGGYTHLLIRRLKELNIRLPKVIFTHKITEDSILGVPVRLIDDGVDVRNLILGSNVYQLEIINRLNTQLLECCNIWDVSPSFHDNWQHFNSSPTTQKYVLIYAVDPTEQPEVWLSNFISWLNRKDIEVVYRHPMQKINEEETVNSLSVILWNGTVGCFSFVKQKLDSLNKLYSFCECGFFPQSEYFYFDKLGINVASQLREDDFSWLPCNYKELVEHKKNELFKNIETTKAGGDFVFVPLQLQSDSNVQLNSRFKDGMQEFIDHIEKQYPNEKIVFKAHPKDNCKSTYNLKRGFWSEANSLALIKSAKRVHGINSTVLFEAALYGVDTVAEGDCLLNFHKGRHTELIAAIILKQHSVSKASYTTDDLLKFSNIVIS